MSRSLTLFVDRDSAMHRLHPLTKLVISGSAFVCGLMLPEVWSSYAVALLVLLPLAISARIAGTLLNRAWRIVLPFAISVFIIQGLFWQSGAIVAELGPLSVKREGLLFATQATGRIVVVVFGFLLLSLVTRPDALMIALGERGLPASVTYIILATIQIVPQFQARAATIIDAQQARGLQTGGGFRNRLRGLLPLVGPLVLRSIVEVEQRAIALEARGFSRVGTKTSMLTLHDSTPQRIVRIGCGVGILASIGVRVWTML
jgi:energy-coupling factor transport system permease protein